MYDHQFVFSDISIILYMSMWTKPNTHTKTDGPSNTFYYYYFSSHFCRGCHWFPCPQESMPLCLHLPSAAQVRWLIINLFLVWRWRVWPCGGWRPGQISLSISLDNGQQTMVTTRPMHHPTLSPMGTTWLYQSPVCVMCIGGSQGRVIN